MIVPPSCRVKRRTAPTASFFPATISSFATAGCQVLSASKSLAAAHTLAAVASMMMLLLTCSAGAAMAALAAATVDKARKAILSVFMP